MAKKRRTDAERRARQCERIGRVLRVLQLVLAQGRPWGVEAIARELEVSERTVYRAIQTLQMAGVPVYHDEQTKGYRVRPGFRMTCLDDLGGTSRPSGPHPRYAGELAEATLDAARRLQIATEDLVALLASLCDSLGSMGSNSGRTRA